MVTGELKNKIDGLWDIFAAGGLVNPLEVIEQITCLMFIHDLDDKRTPVTDNDIPDIIERFRNLAGEADRKRTEKSFLVPKQEIVDNGYDLSINKYKEIEYVPVEYPPTQEIMAELRELERQIGQEMDELERLLCIKI